VKYLLHFWLKIAVEIKQNLKWKNMTDNKRWRWTFFLLAKKSKCIHPFISLNCKFLRVTPTLKSSGTFLFFGTSIDYLRHLSGTPKREIMNSILKYFPGCKNKAWWDSLCVFLGSWLSFTFWNRSAKYFLYNLNSGTFRFYLRLPGHYFQEKWFICVILSTSSKCSDRSL